MKREADVIVVGAGLSGLIAAREVLRAGHEPLVLEASDRVGGRILTEEPAPGVFLELGAQWIGDTHHRMIALAEELGVALYPQLEVGETSYEFNGVVQREAAFHAQHADDVAVVERVLRQLDAMAATVSVAEPWAAPDADVWDRVTVAQWYDSRGLSAVGRELLEICTVGILAVPTSEVSLLGLLVNVVTCGVTADLLSESEGGAQTQRFVGGTDQIPNRLADRLGERAVLNAPVQTIEYSDDAVTVTCRGGLVARGRKVIVALAPALAGRILYDPPLPGQRDQLTQRMPQASAHKMFAVYDEPFWRTDGLNGQLISDAGPARMTNDACMPDERLGILLGFLEGENARVEGRWDAERRHEAFRAELARHFGPRAARPDLIVEGGWADKEWTRGCYNANPGPCGWIHFGQALAAPIGPISWAATETAVEWSGYMEGAVEAGERAAREALEGDRRVAYAGRQIIGEHMTGYDTIVVGAGATGLTAAWRLTQAGQNVLVVEARDRVGGRLRTDRHGESDFEIGGQWISPDQTALSTLVDELGLETYARYRDGDMLYVNAQGEALRFGGDELPVSATTNAAIESLTATLDDLAAKMDPDRPWDHPAAAALDRVTFAQWLEQQTNDAEARDNVALYIGPAMLTKPAYSFSALQAVQMAASAGSFSNLLDADFILDRRVVGGLASVPRELALRLGDRVRLRADVTGIDRSDDRAIVHVNDDALESRHVILALPPTHVARIRINPELPAEHRHARQHQSFGLVIKVQPEYPTPFWRDAGLSGTGFAPYELVHEVYDNTPEGATTGTLVGFVSDVNADTLGRLGDDERRAIVLASIAKYFGPQAEQPITYVESDWQHQELTGGAYATSFAMGYLTRYGRYLREPAGPLWFGSSDVAGLGYQHVDGAVRVGTELAEQILKSPAGTDNDPSGRYPQGASA